MLTTYHYPLSQTVEQGPRRVYGELIPLGGGDPIPLLKPSLTVGRRESCDIVLRFPNVSAYHCQLTLNCGYWYVKDLKSRNGVKVNNTPISERRIDPGDILSIAKHRYEVRYLPIELGAVGPPPSDDDPASIFGKPLLERAGLIHPPRPRRQRPSAAATENPAESAPSADESLIPLDDRGGADDSPQPGERFVWRAEDVEFLGGGVDDSSDPGDES